MKKKKHKNIVISVRSKSNGIKGTISTSLIYTKNSQKQLQQLLMKKKLSRTKTINKNDEKQKEQHRQK